MIAKLFTLGVATAVSVVAFTQISSSNFLNEYKAPDFKFRALSVFANSGSKGGAFEDPSTNSFEFSGKGSVTYRQYSNREKYQGNLRVSTDNNFRINRSDTVAPLRFFNYNTISTSNVFYVKQQWFLGAKLQGHSTTQVFKNSTLGDFTSFTTRISPRLRVGHGRLEPVTFGRAAWDIEKMLEKQNRLSPDFSEADRKILADRIAEISTRRYYDIRLGRIYQMQALDSTLQEFGKITKDDALYYSQLMDAFFYSQRALLYSGIRHEIYVQNDFFYSQVKHTADAFTDDNANLLFGYQFSYLKPLSYAFHQNIRAGARHLLNNVSWIDGSYSLIFQPNTRTQLMGDTRASLAYNNYEGDFGYQLEIGAAVYYYISPRTRVFGEASAQFRDNYTEYRQFWDTSTVSDLSFTYNLNVGLQFAVF